MTTIAFVLLSWRPDAPAGMERAVAASAVGLAATGHRAVIITAHRDGPATYAGAPIAVLGTLTIPQPCGDDALRDTIDAAGHRLQDELLTILTDHDVDIVVYVDGLWGLGRAMPTTGPRRVLAAHVIGHDIDMTEAVARAQLVIAPSPTVLRHASARGYDTAGWRVVPNALLTPAPAPSVIRRRWLREHGPIRVLARLGPEKGIQELLGAASDDRSTGPVDVSLNAAGFEPSPGTQQTLLSICQTLAGHSGITMVPGLRWTQVTRWLASAAVVVVPSLAETFGLVALEAMAGGTPVVAYDIDHLPALLGAGGVIVPRQEGPTGLWRAARDLRADPVRYEQTSRAGYTLSRDYRPAQIADLLVKVVS